MAKKIKISRKQMQRPDEFITWFDRAVDYVREHSLEAVLGVAAVFVALAVWQGILYYQESRRDASIQALSQALMILQAPLQKDLTDQQMLSGARSYASAEERLAAASAQLGKIIKDYPGTPQARQAQLYLAGVQRDAQDYRAAVESYNAYLQANPNLDPEIRTIALMGLATSHFDLGNFQEALNAFQQIIAVPDAFNRDEALVGASSCEENLGRLDEAIALLKQAEEEYPDTVATRNVPIKIRILEKAKEMVQAQPAPSPTPKKAATPEKAAAPEKALVQEKAAVQNKTASQEPAQKPSAETPLSPAPKTAPKEAAPQ
jgi:tetratricopeptide (TPR) repeat protein